jgi:hypothetical protein
MRSLRRSSGHSPRSARRPLASGRMLRHKARTRSGKSSRSSPGRKTPPPDRSPRRRHSAARSRWCRRKRGHSALHRPRTSRSRCRRRRCRTRPERRRARRFRIARDHSEPVCIRRRTRAPPQGRGGCNGHSCNNRLPHTQPHTPRSVAGSRSGPRMRRHKRPARSGTRGLPRSDRRRAGAHPPKAAREYYRCTRQGAPTRESRGSDVNS